MDDIIRLLSALLTPTIGGITTYVAWQQWRGAELKLKVERYERRLKVYQAVCAYLAAVYSNATITADDIRRLRVETAEADFLFDAEISQYLDLLVRYGAELGARTKTYNANIQNPHPSYNHQKTQDEMHAALIWLTEQHEMAKAKFGPYLRIA